MPLSFRPSTFSIVAWDPAAREWGVAVQSKFLGVGAVVPWAQAEVGAVATQAWANTSYGPRGLALLAEGLSADEVVERLVAADEGRDHRQLGVVDRQGRAAAWTGRQCMAWAGHRVGDGFTCQGNILAGSAVVDAMAEAFTGTRGPLAERLLAALAAGQAAGGDRRGQQSAALLVVRAEGGYGRFTDRAVDLRVEDHPRPIEELTRIYRLHQLYFGEPDPADALPVEGELARELCRLLRATGDYRGPEVDAWTPALEEAFERYHGRENFEGRILGPATIDRKVLEHLRAQVGRSG
jgi:uncharacterized Ntn-hydrolase superfamily protein